MKRLKLADRGWLKHYLDIRENYLSDSLQENNELKNTNKKLYQIIQPSGLIYGHATQIPAINFDDKGKWELNDKIKLVFTESLLQTGCIFYPFENKSINNKETCQTILFLAQKYLSTILQDQQARNFFQRRFSPKKEYEKTEYLIEKITNITTSQHNFWISFFHNSLLFLEIIFFGEWLKQYPNQQDELIYAKRQRIHLVILKIIALVANIDNQQNRKEQKLFDYFLHSTSLKGDDKKNAQLFLIHGVNIHKIDFSDANNWILKKYILELSVLMAKVNKDVHEKELNLLKILTRRLGLQNEELESSLLAVDAFILENKQEVHYLQSKHNFHLISRRMIKQLNKMLRKNQKRLQREISQSKELIYLLNKSRNQPLNKEEKNRMRAQLIDILKTVPMIVIIALPFSFLTLPVLLKIFPKEVLYPGAFLDDEE